MKWFGHFRTIDEWNQAIEKRFEIEAKPGDTPQVAALRAMRKFRPDDADLIQVRRNAGQQGFKVTLDGANSKGKYGFTRKELGTCYIGQRPR